MEWESSIEHEFVEALELTEEWECFKLDKLPNKKGRPDQLCLGPDGRKVIVEFKRTENDDLRKLQSHYFKKFYRMGHRELYVVGGRENMERLKYYLLCGGKEPKDLKFKRR